MKRILTLVLTLTLVIGAFGLLTSCNEKTTEPPVTEEPAAEVPTEEPKANDAAEDAPMVDDVVEENPATDEPANNETASESINLEEVSKLPKPIATIEMDTGEKIVLELLPEYAPNTVSNFVSLASSGFYDGVIIHRTVPGFVIQGGDPDGTGMGGPGYGIAGEFIENGFTQNKLSHTRGVLSMARSIMPDSAGSQFFIVVDDAAIPSLDQKYAGFGIVTSGMDVVDKIVNAPIASGTQDTPAQPRVIKSITIDTQGAQWPAPATIAGQ